MRFLFVILAGLVLAGCVTTTTTTVGSYPENRTTARCFSGGHVFDLDTNLPASYGRIYAMTQFASSDQGLEPVCRLVVPGTRLVRDTDYPIYAGEVDGGNAGLCVSARTETAGHVYSCASAAQVRRAMAAGPNRPDGTIVLSTWRPLTSAR